MFIINDTVKPAFAFQALTEELLRCMDRIETPFFYLALSGGETAKLLFQYWAQNYRERICWERIRFYWVDERCVVPDDDESNFKYADELLFRPLDIPEEHVCRIRGENTPETEAIAYSALVASQLSVYNGLPCFDCIILGIGADEHVASIFPSERTLLTDPRSFAVSRHPISGQRRITMTGRLILNGKILLIPMVGNGKADVVSRLSRASVENELTPAAYILKHAVMAVVFV